jgi:hypothetical protein
MVSISKKKQLDKQRTEWRKKHRTLNGKIIIYPEKSPEHINARASKMYNWFWKKILLDLEMQEIPAVISGIKKRIKIEQDSKKIQMYRTMIGMSEDAYHLKRLENIKDYDTDLQLGKKSVYNTGEGIIYKNGKIYTTDYNEDESKIILRDIEGILIDALFSEDKKQRDELRNNIYKNWNYMEKTEFANK